MKNQIRFVPERASFSPHQNPKMWTFLDNLIQFSSFQNEINFKMLEMKETAYLFINWLIEWVAEIHYSRIG